MITRKRLCDGKRLMGFEPTTFCMAIRSRVCGGLRLLASLPANRRFRE